MLISFYTFTAENNVPINWIKKTISVNKTETPIKSGNYHQGLDQRHSQAL